MDDGVINSPQDFIADMKLIFQVLLAPSCRARARRCVRACVLVDSRRLLLPHASRFVHAGRRQCLEHEFPLGLGFRVQGLAPCTGPGEMGMTSTWAFDCRVWQNAMRYNPEGHDVHVMAKKLLVTPALPQRLPSTFK
jgi:hypothetical protein